MVLRAATHHIVDIVRSACSITVRVNCLKEGSRIGAIYLGQPLLFCVHKHLSRKSVPAGEWKYRCHYALSFEGLGQVSAYLSRIASSMEPKKVAVLGETLSP